MRAIIASCVVVVCTMGVLMAEEFGAMITKMETKDGKTTISGKKGKKGSEEAFTMTVAKDCKVNKAGKYDKTSKTYAVGDAIEGGVKEALKDASEDKSIGVQITAEKDMVTQILVKGKKKGS